MPQETTRENPNQGMRLSIELGSLLTIQAPGLDEKFQSILVGLEPQSYLIIRLTSISTLQNYLDINMDLKVQYQSRSNIFGFNSAVIDIIKKPFNLIFLSYPSKVTSLNLRDSKRVNCYIPATAVLGKAEFKGVVEDISVSGCRFTIQIPSFLEPYQINVINEIKLSFLLLGMKNLKKFIGVVRNTTQTRESISLGIEFKNLDSDILERINTYVKCAAGYEDYIM